MASNVSNGTYEDLVRLNDQRANTLIPAMVLFSFFMLMGLVGNSLVCYIIGFRFQSSNQNFLIVWLAIFDLLSCLVAIPTDIVDMRFSYIFPSAIACKILRFIMAFTSIGGAFILVTIAVDRYRKICTPFKSPMSRLHVKIALVIAITAAVFYSWPALIIFGLRIYKSPIKGQMAHDCSTSDKIKDTHFPLIYTGLLFLTFIGMCVVLITLYCTIMIKIKRHCQHMRKVSVTSLVPASQRKHSTKEIAVGSAKNKHEGNNTKYVNEAEDESSFDKRDENTSNCVGQCQSKIRAKEIDLGKETEVKQLKTEKQDSKFNDVAIADNKSESAKVKFMTEVPAEAKEQVNNSEDLPLTDVSNLSMDNNTSSVNIHGGCQDVISKPTQKTKCNDMVPSSSFHHPSSVTESHVQSDTTHKVDCGKKSKPCARKTNATTPDIPKLETKMTKIAFSVTLVFILSFLPYLSLQIAKTVYDGFDYNLRGVSFLFQNIFLRSYYINAISNPFIYGALNPRFRREAKTLFRKCICYRQS